MNALYLLADDLKYFGFQAFTTAFIGELKKEIPVVIDESNKDFDWNAIGNSKQLKTRPQKRAKRRKLNDELMQMIGDVTQEKNHVVYGSGGE